MVTLTNRTNTLISHFLNCSNSYSKDVQTRLKLSSTIKEFDTKLNKDVSLFVNLSNSRYRSVKNGIKLNTVISNQKEKYNYLSHEIMTDGFYNSKDIRTEKDKLILNIKSSTKAKMINKIRNNIKTLTQENYLFQFLDKTKSTQHSAVIQQSTSNQFFSSKRRSMSEINKPSETILDKTKKEDKYVNNNENRKLIGDSNIEIIANIVKDDNKFINNQFNEYRNYLNSIQEELPNKDNDINNNDNSNKNKEQLNMKHSKTDPKMLFSSNRFKLLSYNYKPVKEVVIKKPVDLSIDLQKIFKYTKRGQRSTWRLNQLMTPSPMNITNESSHRKESTLVSYPNEKCNTLYKVKSEAKNLMLIEDKLNLKRERIDHLFSNKKAYLPGIANNETTDMMILNDKNNSHNRTTRRLSISFNHINNNTNKTYNSKHGSIKSTRKKSEEERVLKHSLQPLYDTLENIFMQKNNEWDKEDKERQLSKQRPTQEELKVMHSFLININKLPRKTQLYIDEYSIRNKDNEIISNFTKSLGNTFHNKQSINRLIKGFLFQTEKRNIINGNKMKCKPMTLKELEKEAYLSLESKSHLPLDYKLKFKNEGKRSEVELGDNNGKSDYVPHYLRVIEKNKEAKINDEYEELIKFRKFVEKKYNKKKPKKTNSKTFEINDCIINGNDHIKRKESLGRFNLTQDYFMQNANENYIPK